MIRSLLVCDCLPSSHYGTGQRLLTLQTALAALGECRVLHLTNESGETAGPTHYRAPVPFDHRASRAAWVWHHLSFAAARPDRCYWPVFERIHSEFPFDAIFCSFFRSTPAIPTDMAPCLLDFDAIPERTGPLTRALWPLTLRAMRRRAKDFRALYVIRQSDAEMLEGVGSSVRVIPGISAVAPASPPGHNPDARRVLFVAPTAWQPNAAAVDWLLDIGVPEALNRLGYELRLVGQGTDRFGSRPGLSSGGFVKDLAAEYAAARLVLCPIWSGTGANIKLGEAIQFGRAILATRHSAQAYDGFLRANEELLTFDQPGEFMDLLVGIMQDSSRLRALEMKASEAASKFLNQSYVSRIIAEDVARLCQFKFGAE
jgi:hypothetical protein